jgi:hypothetical protein
MIRSGHTPRRPPHRPCAPTAVWVTIHPWTFPRGPVAAQQSGHRTGPWTIRMIAVKPGWITRQEPGAGIRSFD